MTRRKIGIVLLCNEHGYPLRWEVVGGCRHDSKTMTEMLRSIQGLSWVRSAPVVVDRAMGKTAQIRDMLATGLRFVTALTVVEYPAYAPGLPHEPFAELQPDIDAPEKSVALAARLALQAGLEKVADDLFAVDLGIVERADHPRSQLDAPSDEDLTVTAMRLCRTINDAVAQRQFASYNAAGRHHGLGLSLTRKYRELRSLPEQIQLAVLSGEVAARPLCELLRVARISAAQEQWEAFEALRRQPPRARRKDNRAAVQAEPQHEPGVRVRLVAYFNPQRFVDRRLSARQAVAQIENFATALNAKLASPRSTRTRDSIAAAVDRKLRAYELLDAYEVTITEQQVAGRTGYQVKLTLDPAEWARRRRYDGFHLLVTHPDVELDAAGLSRLYRAKDAVEKDFQVIKSFIKLRPLRHRTNAKVRAHVTICMLALLLERTLRRKLPSEQSAQAALEGLGTCHLNEYRAARRAPVYTITAAEPDQEKILRRLKLQPLTDDLRMMESITPR